MSQKCLTSDTPPSTPFSAGWHPGAAPEIQEARRRGIVDAPPPSIMPEFSIFESPKNFSASISADGSITLRPLHPYDNAHDSLTIAMKMPARADGSYEISRVKIDLLIGNCGSAQHCVPGTAAQAEAGQRR